MISEMPFPCHVSCVPKSGYCLLCFQLSQVSLHVHVYSLNHYTVQGLSGLSRPHHHVLVYIVCMCVYYMNRQCWFEFDDDMH